MAIVFDSVSIKGLRLAHFEQLQAYLDWVEAIGERYGQGIYGNNPKQFGKRHAELAEWLAGILEYAASPDVIIPIQRKIKNERET
jgi:hypothetical protein